MTKAVTRGRTRPKAPRVEVGNIDEFSAQLHAFVKEATPDEMRRAVYVACRYLENSTILGHTNARVHLNNCTETFVTVAGEMARRLSNTKPGEGQE